MLQFPPFFISISLFQQQLGFPQFLRASAIFENNEIDYLNEINFRWFSQSMLDPYSKKFSAFYLLQKMECICPFGS